MRITWQKIMKETVVFTLFFTLVSIVFTLFIVQGVHNNIQIGRWDSYLERTDSTAEYMTLQEGLVKGPENRVLHTQEGILYKRDIGSHTINYVILDQWLAEQGLERTSWGIKTFVEENSTMQIIRTLSLSNSTYLLLYLYPFMLILGYFGMPVLLIIGSRLYTGGRIITSQEEEERSHMVRVQRITTGLLIDSVYNHYEKRNYVFLATSLYAYLMAGQIQHHLAELDGIGTIIMGYSLVLILLTAYYISNEYRSISQNRVENYMKEEQRYQETLAGYDNKDEGNEQSAVDSEEIKEYQTHKTEKVDV